MTRNGLKSGLWPIFESLHARIVAPVRNVLTSCGRLSAVSPHDVTKAHAPGAAPPSVVALSVVIPAYNEELRLPSTLDDALHVLQSFADSWEIIIVDDGSTDRTSSVVAAYTANNPQITSLSLPQNQGKGAAVKAGLLHARGARRLFMDADGSTSLRELPRLMNALDNGADIAIGSRAVKSRDIVVDARWYRRYPGRIFNACINALLLPGIADTQCGFKIFTARAVECIVPHQESMRFSFDLELLYLARRKGLRIDEVPVNWHNVAGSKVNVMLDGPRMLGDAIRIRFRHRTT